MEIISVFIQNKPGRLSQILHEISSRPIFGFSIADAGEFGIVRLCVQDPHTAVNDLKRHDLIAHVTDAIAIRSDDLKQVISLFDIKGINVEEALYAVMENKGPLVILKVQEIDTAKDILTKEGFEFF